MKKIRSLNYLCIAIFSLLFIACEDEPLEGNFPLPDGEEVDLQPGSFTATVDQVNFTAIVSSATLTENGILTITGSGQGTGDLITMTVENGGEGLFNLNPEDGTVNAGMYINLLQPNNPYNTTFDTGSGELVVSQIDVPGLTITGAFNFNANRVRLDANGNPVMDSAGNVIREEIVIENGVFLAIPLTLIGDADPDDPDGDPDNGEEAMDNIFEATVDVSTGMGARDFEATTVSSELAMITDLNIIRIMATNANGEMIRLDIPEDLGIGTFMITDQVNAISDGTQLFGIYNEGNGMPNLTSNSGTVTITSISTQTGRIEGTFNFMGDDPLDQVDDTVSVTNGSFTIFYTPDPNNAQASFNCDVDTIPYTSTQITNETTLFGPDNIELVKITATDGVQQITITFPKATTTAGNFVFSPETIDATEYVATYIPDTTVMDPITFTSSAGVITFNSYNENTGAIEGAYFFTATDPTMTDATVHEITNGTFTLVIN